MAGRLSLSPQGWHNRFSQQARWTQELRRHLYSRVGAAPETRILDVGCGTGALQLELYSKGYTHIHGVDINPDFLEVASRNNPAGTFTLGDAHSLPYANASFDISFCHFLLLWVKEPAQVLREMSRVTRFGGALMVLAEPDYGGRIDYPLELVPLGRLQADALRDQGAEPDMGRRLRGLLSGLGLENVETGVLGAQWSGGQPPEEIESEWKVLRSDLGDMVSQEQLDQWQSQDYEAWQRGTRILFVPTFYGWGTVPE